MKKIIVPLALFALTFMSGCTVYMDQQTPAGFVPPVQPVAAPTMEQGLMDAYGAPITPEGEVALQQAYTGSVIKVAPRGLGQQAPIMASGSFEQSYAAAGEPRIAVYFNRVLSDEVRDWRGRERLVGNATLKARGEFEKIEDGKSAVFGRPMTLGSGDAGNESASYATVAAEINGSLEHQTFIENEQRVPVVETWGWSLEEGFNEPFMNANCNLVDRSTILRLAGNDSRTENGDKLSLRTIEVDALKNYADIFIELLIADANRPGVEPTVKATVKDINTGMVLANTTLRESDLQLDQPYVATANGFQKAAAEDLDPYVMGSALAERVMVALERRWSR